MSQTAKSWKYKLSPALHIPTLFQPCKLCNNPSLRCLYEDYKIAVIKPALSDTSPRVCVAVVAVVLVGTESLVGGTPNKGRDTDRQPRWQYL